MFVRPCWYATCNLCECFSDLEDYGNGAQRVQGFAGNGLAGVGRAAGAGVLARARRRRARQTVTANYHPERRVLRDRRRMRAGPGLEHGWVCFQSEAEKRRLAPPPSDWGEAADDALEALLGRAEPIPRRRPD